MRKFAISVFAFIIILVSLLLLAKTFVNPTQAVNDPSNSTQRETVQEKAQLRQEKKDELREKIATKTAQLRKEQVEKLKQVFARILDRFGAALTRLDRIVGKLERRMDKLSQRGVDTQKAKSALEGCQSKKAIAEAAIADSRTKVEAIDANSATVRETVHTSVEALRNAKKAIRDYHKCLVDVVKILKVTKPKEGTTSAQ